MEPPHDLDTIPDVHRVAHNALCLRDERALHSADVLHDFVKQSRRLVHDESTSKVGTAVRADQRAFKPPKSVRHPHHELYRGHLTWVQSLWRYRHTLRRWNRLPVLLLVPDDPATSLDGLDVLCWP